MTGHVNAYNLGWDHVTAARCVEIRVDSTIFSFAAIKDWSIVLMRYVSSSATDPTSRLSFSSRVAVISDDLKTFCV